MKNVLYIGPAYKDHRGGIGAVLSVYASHIRPFKFIRTYSYGNPLQKAAVYIGAVFTLVWKLITDRDIRIVHIHSASRGSFLRKSVMVMIARLFRKKVIIHIHGAEFHLFYEEARRYRWFLQFILRRADMVICLSDRWKDFFSGHFRLKKLAIVKNVMEEPLTPASPYKKGQRINLLFLGAVGDRKGIFDLLEVLRLKNGLRDRVTLTIGGNGEIERLNRSIIDYRLGDHVQYAGWVKNGSKNELLHQCDVYVLPSYNEGLPISILEAMAYGKAVISTTVGGIPEIVRPGYNGWLFEPGDKTALGKILEDALADPARLEQYGRNSLLISKEYSPDAVFDTLRKLYLELNPVNDNIR